MKFSVFKDFSQNIGEKTIVEISELIKSDKYSSQIHEIRIALSEKNEELHKSLKSKLLAFTPSAILKGKRIKKNIKDYTKVIHLDFDKLSREDLKKSLFTIRNIEETLMSYISPSGNGIKVFVKVDSTIDQHGFAYNKVKEFYELKLGVVADRVCKDVARLCFVSYDPNLYFNENALVFKINSNNIDEVADEKNLEDISDYLDVIEQIWESSKLKFENINGNRNNLIYYFACNCNRHGLPLKMVIDISRNKSDLPTNEIITTVNGVYKNNFEEHGTIHNQIGISHDSIDGEMPTLPDSIFGTIPDFLKKIVSAGKTNEERDVLLLSALTTLSSTISNFYGVYHRNIVKANFFLFIAAKASSGKSIMNNCRSLVLPIHEDMIKHSKEKSELKGIDNIEKHSYKGPLIIKRLFIPADNSASGFFENLLNSGGSGLMFETEADTLSFAFKKEHGNFSDGLRKVFHHEMISFYRRTNKELIELSYPCLSVLMSGTPNQVKSLIGDAENGLFSRFLFYKMNFNSNWENVFECNLDVSNNVYFEKLGKDYFQWYTELKKINKVNFKLTDLQITKFNDYFDNLNENYKKSDNQEMLGVVKRLGLISYRIMMVFTSLRYMDKNTICNEVYCSDMDYLNTIAIIDVLRYHSFQTLRFLNNNRQNSGFKDRRDEFLVNLPIRFNRNNYLIVANKLGIPDKTAQRYISYFVYNRNIVKERHDCYKKLE